MDRRTLEALDRGYAGGRPAPAQLEPGDAEVLAAAGITLGDDAGLDGHDVVIERARVAAGSIDLAGAADAFVVGLAQSWPRGVSVLGAFASVRNVPAHGFEPHDGPVHGQLVDHDPRTNPVCATCGLLGGVGLDVDAPYVLWWSWQGLYPRFGLPGAVVDLEDAASAERPAPTDDDRAVVRRALDVLRDLPATTSPTAAGEALAKAKVLPKPSATVVKGGPARIRSDLLHVLADVGVLAQGAIASPLDGWTTPGERTAAWDELGLSFRNDTPLPLAAWRGGLDEARVTELFGER